MSSNLFDLDRKAIIVTGGMGQLGRQFVRALVEHGAKVAILDIVASDDAVTAKFGDLLDAGSVMASHCDITSRKSIKNALVKVTERFGCGSKSQFA